MTIESENLLKNSFCITVNTQRVQNFLKSFQQANLNPTPKIFPGFKIGLGKHEFGWLRNNVINCSISHACIIKHAMMLNLPWVCVFEDDALPCKDIIEKLKFYLTDIPDNVNVLKLGRTVYIDNQWKPSKDQNIEKDKKYNTVRSYGAHSYIVFRKHYQKYFEIFERHPIADHWCINCEGCYNTNDILFLQKNSATNPSVLHNSKTEELYRRYKIDISNFKF